MGSTWNSTGAVWLGDGHRGAATFTISNGGTANHYQASIECPKTGTVTTATVDGSGSTWNIDSHLWVFSSGRSATLNLTNGGVLNVAGGGGTVKLGANTKLNIGTGGVAGTLNAAVVEATTHDGSTGAVNLNHTGTTTFGANILGQISVMKSGSGTTILTGAGHTFTGAMMIDAGTLQIGGGGAASFGTGSIVDNAALVVNNSNTVAISGAISGSGTLTKTGAGTLALSGENSYAGGTVEFGSVSNFGSAGTVTLAGGGLRWASGSTADISPRLAALGVGATSFDTNGNNVALATALTGAGGLAKNGAGTLSLSGACSYTGATTVNAGTLQLAGSGTPSFASAIINNSALAFAPTNTLYLNGGISGAGTVTALGGTTVINHASSYSGDTIVKGGATLTVRNSVDTNSAAVSIGYQGTGTLSVASGGALTSGYAYLGRFNGDAGYADIVGTSTAPAVTVGYGGGGQLTLHSGGTLNADLYLGSFSTGVGTLNIGGGDTR